MVLILLCFFLYRSMYLCAVNQRIQGYQVLHIVTYSFTGLVYLQHVTKVSNHLMGLLFLTALKHVAFLF